MSDDRMSLDHEIRGGGMGDDLNITLTIELDRQVRQLLERTVRQLEQE